jgi:hypothetical protein
MRTKYAILFSMVVFLSLLIFQAAYIVAGKQNTEASLISITIMPASGSAARSGFGLWEWPIPQSQPIPTLRQSLPLPPFVICPSGLGHSRCYIDWNVLFRWLCQRHYLPTFICRWLGF